jgi:hypothetical protein
LATVLVLNDGPRHEDEWGSGGIVPCFYNLGTSLETSGKPHAPAALSPTLEQSRRYSMDRRLRKKSKHFTRVKEKYLKLKPELNQSINHLVEAPTFSRQSAHRWR